MADTSVHTCKSAWLSVFQEPVYSGCGGSKKTMMHCPQTRGTGTCNNFSFVHVCEGTLQINPIAPACVRPHTGEIFPM